MSETQTALELPTVADFARTFRRIQAEIHKVIVGHEQAVEQLLSALFAGGHVLIEGVPGTGKTTLVKTLGRALNLSFNRIQFTVDLMPADITGTRVVTETPEGGRTFVFVPGPIFTHVLLADEINRATPKTQSALLEAMAEQQVTVAGATHALDAPFFVLATLNPIEMEGTYQLPEAQLDRFLFKVLLQYPSQEELERILAITTGADTPVVRPVLDVATAPARVEELRRLVRSVLVAPHVERYVATLVRMTQPGADGDAEIRRWVAYGASPRGGQALLLGAKVYALLDGRPHVAYEDVDRVVRAALRHRLVLTFAAETEGIEAATVVERVLASVVRHRR
jgi:MoxR-like ATPase